MVRAALLVLTTLAAGLVATAPPAVAAPPPDPPLPATTPGVLAGVSCVSDSFCLAAGTAPDHRTSSDRAGLVDRRDALGHWHPRQIRPPDRYDSFSGVSCRSEVSCLAVGARQSGSDSALAATWDGRGWTQVATPPSIRSFEAVSCPPSGPCVAVGETAFSLQFAAATWDGSTWAVTPVPAPTEDHLTARLHGVSCPTADWCLAVGDVLAPSGVPRTATAVFDGTAWTLDPVRSAPPGVDSTFTAVDCVSATFCAAVGSSDNSHVFAEVWDGSAWTRTPVPPHTFGAVLFGVSCALPTACLAVGRSVDTGIGTLAVVWNGNTWTRTPPTATRVDLRAAVVFSGVSCTRPDRCVAVGSVTASRPLYRQVTVAEGWDGHRWTAEPS